MIYKGIKCTILYKLSEDEKSSNLSHKSLGTKFQI